MRVLLDECLPSRLKQELVGHDVVTVPEAGWAGKQNGELVSLAKGRFDVFVTIDQNLPAQRPARTLEIAVIILSARSNRFQDIRPLIPELLKRLESIARPTLIRVGASR